MGIVGKDEYRVNGEKRELVGTSGLNEEMNGW